VAFRLTGAAAHWPLYANPPVWVEVLFYFGLVNVWVGAFNLIPVPPLDGSVLVERLLPRSLWPGYLRARQYALPVLFIGIIALSWVHVYPTQPLIDRLTTWWANLLGV
jgi:Zn-dependent protease